MITLRTLQKADMDLIRQWPPYTGDMKPMDYALRYEGWLDEFWGQPDVFLFAAMDEEELVGFAILIKTASSEAEFRIALRADKTGQRLGEIITSLTLRKGFEELDISRIHLIVRKTNNRGIRLYQRLGFKSCGNCSKKIKEEWIDFIQMAINEKNSTTEPKEETIMCTEIVFT